MYKRQGLCIIWVGIWYRIINNEPLYHSISLAMWIGLMLLSFAGMFLTGKYLLKTSQQYAEDVYKRQPYGKHLKMQDLRSQRQIISKMLRQIMKRNRLHSMQKSMNHAGSHINIRIWKLQMKNWKQHPQQTQQSMW